MTYSISPSFTYIRPINILNDGTIYRMSTAKAPTWQAVRHDRSAIVACHNLASALAYASGRLPDRITAPREATVKVQAFVAPSGQFYVQHGNQRMDVANAGSARHYVKHGVPVSVMLSASLSSLNQ